MKILKIFPLLIVSIFIILTSCAMPTTLIDLSPDIMLPQQDPSLSLLGVTISVTSSDQRRDNTLARVVQGNKSFILTASRDLQHLLQEVFEKQMISRGYMIGKNGTVNLQIIINNLYSNIFRENIRYNIITKSDITVIATTTNGNKMIKNYYANHSMEGVFQITNKSIKNAVNNVLTSIISEMSKDTSIHNFIKQNA